MIIDSLQTPRNKYEDELITKNLKNKIEHRIAPNNLSLNDSTNLKESNF